MRYFFSTLCVISILIVCTRVTFAAPEQKEFVIEENSPIHKELMPLAILWKDAILTKDFNLISRSVLPENYDYDKNAFNNQDSELYRFLYNTNFVEKTGKKRKSVYDLLKASKKLKIILVGREPLSVFGVTAYYYDESKIKLKFPLITIQKQNLWLVKYVACGFIKINTDWKLSFELQFQDEE